MTTTSDARQSPWPRQGGIASARELAMLLVGSGLLGLLLAAPTRYLANWQVFLSAVLVSAFVALLSSQTRWPVLGGALGTSLGMFVLSLLARGAVPQQGRIVALAPWLPSVIWAAAGMGIGLVVGTILRDLQTAAPVHTMPEAPDETAAPDGELADDRTDDNPYFSPSRD